jgi:hypothetical protein
MDLDAKIKNHPIFVYGAALCAGVVAGIGFMVTSISISGRTIVSADEIRQLEKAKNDLARELESARTATPVAQRERIADLERKIQSLDAENSRLKLAVKGTAERADAVLAATQSEQAGNRAPAASGGGPPRPIELSNPKSSLSRQTIELRAGTPRIINQTVTVTLDYIDRGGASFLINGARHPRGTTGVRFDVSSFVGKKCFLEIMALSPETAAAKTATLDYVCAATS